MPLALSCSDRQVPIIAMPLHLFLLSSTPISRSHLEAVATARVEEEAARAQLQWSERSLAERAEMARGVDALRAKTNALAEALQRRSDDQRGVYDWL